MKLIKFLILKILTTETRQIKIDYGDGACDRIVTVTINGESKDVEVKAKDSDTKQSQAEEQARSNKANESIKRTEAGIKKKLANPTKDNIEIVRQLIKKAEIKKLFKDGGKDLKALISDIIR